MPRERRLKGPAKRDSPLLLYRGESHLRDSALRYLGYAIQQISYSENDFHQHGGGEGCGAEGASAVEQSMRKKKGGNGDTKS